MTTLRSRRRGGLEEERVEIKGGLKIKERSFLGRGKGVLTEG